MSNEQRGREALETLDKALKSRDRAEKSKPLAVVAMSAVAILAIVGLVWFLATRDSGDTEAADEATSTEQTTDQELKPLALERSEALPETVTCTYNDSAGEAAKPVSTPDGQNVSTKGTVTVNLKTNQGDIPMELDRSTSPCATNALVHLAESGYFNDTVCHRLTTQGISVLQCGDPTGQGTGGPGFTFADEYPADETGAEQSQQPVVYPRGSIAMANSGPDTNGSQFFLNYGDSPLQPNYSYVGTITDKGLKTLDGIAEKGVEGGQSDGKPAEEVRITAATVKQ